jgi:Na+/proline symporter
MALSSLDWSIIIGFLALSLAIGVAVARKSGRNTAEFFLSGRNMPWWLLGVSMVATTFSADTPNLVTDIVRQNGVSGNWVWWAFLLTGMLTVFVYARLWRRSGMLTDLEFYEIRYSGRPAAIVRGFRSLYLGVFFNVMILASVCLAAIKQGSILLNLSPAETVVIGATVTVLYSALGGLRGVLLTDFFQFIVAMIGSVGAAVVVVNLPEVGGLDGLLSNEAIVPRLSILPEIGNTEAWITLLIVPIAVQWWSVWYPGAEPGGGGYIAQRMLSARSEDDAVGATLFFNAAHYALRPWPWIIVALSSLILFPELSDLERAFPDTDPAYLGHDLAYSAMLTYLPAGLLGLVVASLIAAFMSTLSTQLNWGASYVVNDFYGRFIDPAASEHKKVWLGRANTAILMILGGGFALLLSNALQAFNIILQVGAGTGLLFILRWFWWRINAWSEISAMVVSFLVAIYLQLVHTAIGFEPLSTHLQLIVGVVVTTIAWVAVTYLTQPTDEDTLIAFCRLTRPGGPGWRAVLRRAEERGDDVSDLRERSWTVPDGIIAMVVGTTGIYGLLFGVGQLIYGNLLTGSSMLAIATLCGIVVARRWTRIARIETIEDHDG